MEIKPDSTHKIRYADGSRTLAIKGNTAVTGTLSASGSTTLAAVSTSGSVTTTGYISATADGAVIYARPATGNGVMTVYTKVVDHTTDSGGLTETLTGFFPAGALVLGAQALITTIVAMTTGVSWSMGVTGDVDLFAAGLALAADTSTDGTDYAADFAINHNPAALDLLLTANAGTFDSGVVRVTGYYMMPTAATS